MTQDLTPSEAPDLNLEQLLMQRPWLKSLARRLLADEHGAEDVMQDAWVMALERPPRESRALVAWMREVVRTLALRRKRGEQRLRRREEFVARPEGSVADDTVADRLRTQREVVDAVLALDEPLRETVHARYFEELAPREIARRQGVSIDTVNDRLKRARRKLRTDLGRRLGQGGQANWGLCLLPLAQLMPEATRLLETQLAAGGVAVGATATVYSTPGLLTQLVMMKKTLVAALALVAAIGSLMWIQGQDAAGSTQTLDATDAGGLLISDSDAPALGPEVEDPGLPLEAPEVTASADRKPAATPEVWTLSGHVFLGTSAPAPQAKIIARMWEGYDTTGPALIEKTLTSDADGRFTWPLASPHGTVSATVGPGLAQPHGQTDSAIIPLGTEPPQDLVVFLFPADMRVTGTIRNESGEPIAGATVSASSADTTDSEGHYAVHASSFRAKEFLYAHAPGYAQVRASIVTAGRGVDVACDLSLRRAFSISGRIVGENKQPVADAQVTSFYGHGNSVASDAMGEFELLHLDPGHGSHTVSVLAPGYVMFSETLETRSGDPVERVFELERGARVSGRVVDETGQGIPAVQVCAGFSVNAWNALWVYTRDAGQFELECVPHGEVTLWIEHPGFAAIKRTIQIPESGDFNGELTIVLGSGRIAAGKVVDETGQTIPGVRVSARFEKEWTRKTAETDGEGIFLLELLPAGEVELTFNAKGLDRVQVDLGPGDQRDLQIRMAPSGGIAGRVIDAATGAPVEAFRIRLAHAQEPGKPHLSLWSTWTREGHSFSNEEGEWHSQGLELPVGRNVLVQVIAEGYAATAFSSVVVEAEPDPNSCVIALTEGQRVNGRVVDASTGAAVVGARISLKAMPNQTNYKFSDPWSADFARTDAAGEFSFENIRVQKISFDVEHADYSEHSYSGPHTITETGPDQNILIEMGGAGTISGVALDKSGAPRVGADLLLLGVEVRGVLGSFARWQCTDHEGRFVFKGLPQGYYRLGSECAHINGGDADIERGIGVLLRGDTNADVVLQASGHATVLGTLVMDGNMPEHVQLELMIIPVKAPVKLPFTHPYFTVIAEDGVFTLKDIPAGNYTVESEWFVGGARILGEKNMLDLEAGGEMRRKLRLLAR